MTHGSLFSGIGGFDLAAQWVGWQNIWQCEKDKFCQKVLSKNFPGKIIYDDIITTDWTQAPKVDVISGGFPCQPFSQAGKRTGKEDDRYLWPAMLEVISAIRPTWVVGENVAGIVSMALDDVCADLENQGYEVQPVIIPACAVGATHRRDRVWILAYASSKRVPRLPSQAVCRESSFHGDQNVGGTKDLLRRPSVYAPKLCRGGDGISNRMDRLKSLGNAIVPQVAYEIFMGIDIIENSLP